MIDLIAALLWLQETDTPTSVDDPAAEALAFFEPLLGRTWIMTGQPDGAPVDIVRWERVVDGRIVQSTHSLNHGAYGGRTLYFWDYENERVAYHYATTANFYTTGYLTPIDSTTIESLETVHGPIGIDRLRAQFRLRPDGYEVNV
ncbi:hypothetical protein [Hyphobacterium sp.]|jgi:hypothetical protein|uniref:hypothetical protein n=1 Tax=Hyphobacterium sp. TaxID=2004662 RepID=UPI003BAA70E8